MKRIYYSLLCLLAFLQVGIAQTREIKTFSGRMPIPSKELKEILNLVGEYNCVAHYYEIEQKDDLLGIPKKVFHGEFSAQYTPELYDLFRSQMDTLKIQGQFLDGKMVGQWIWEGTSVSVDNDKYTFFLNDTLKKATKEANPYMYAEEQPQDYVYRRAKVVDSRLRDTLYFTKFTEHWGKWGSTEVILPVDEKGWAHGVCIIKHPDGEEERYRYHHGVCIALGKFNSKTGEQKTTQNPQMKQITQILNSNTDEFTVDGKCYIRKPGGKFPFDIKKSYNLFITHGLVEWSLKTAFADCVPCPKHQTKTTKKTNGVYTRGKRH